MICVDADQAILKKIPISDAMMHGLCEVWHHPA